MSKRLNDMRFCECGHGQGAHRNGAGHCVGERMVQGTWISCECLAFVAERQPARTADHPLRHHHEGLTHDNPIDTGHLDYTDSGSSSSGSSPDSGSCSGGGGE